MKWQGLRMQNSLTTADSCTCSYRGLAALRILLVNSAVDNLRKRTSSTMTLTAHYGGLGPEISK